MKDRPHDEAMAVLFQQDPVYALEFLNSTLEDGEQGELLIALESGRFRGEDAQVTDSKTDVPSDPSFSSPNIGDFSRCGVVPSRSGGLF